MAVHRPPEPRRNAVTAVVVYVAVFLGGMIVGLFQ
jgi:hypothetical protein